jgi:hypothetical protein
MLERTPRDFVGQAFGSGEKPEPPRPLIITGGLRAETAPGNRLHPVVSS